MKICSSLKSPQNHGVKLQNIFQLNSMSATSSYLITRWGNWGWKYFYPRHSASQRPWRQLPVRAIFHSFNSPFRGMCAKRPQDLEGADRSALEKAFMEAVFRAVCRTAWAEIMRDLHTLNSKNCRFSRGEGASFAKSLSVSLDGEEAEILISAWFSEGLSPHDPIPSLFFEDWRTRRELCGTRTLISSLTGQVEGQENTAAKFVFSA